MTKLDHMVPQVVVNLVETKNKAWKNSSERLQAQTRLEAIYEYVGNALRNTPNFEYIESRKSIGELEGAAKPSYVRDEELERSTAYYARLDPKNA